MIVLGDEASGAVLHDHEVELAGSEVVLDQDLERRAPDVRGAEAGEPDGAARRRECADVEMPAAEGELRELERRVGREKTVSSIMSLPGCGAFSEPASEPLPAFASLCGTPFSMKQ